MPRVNSLISGSAWGTITLRARPFRAKLAPLAPKTRVSRPSCLRSSHRFGRSFAHALSRLLNMHFRLNYIWLGNPRRILRMLFFSHLNFSFLLLHGGTHHLSTDAPYLRFAPLLLANYLMQTHLIESVQN